MSEKDKGGGSHIEYSATETHRLISNIVRVNTINGLKENVESFIRYIESVDKKRKPWMCKQFIDALMRWGYTYSFKTSHTDHNVTIVPPNHAPVLFMFTEIPVTTKSKLVIDGMKRFVERCGEFIDPLEPTITEEEIIATLRAGQEAFGLIDIIAPNEPLKILRLNHSHVKHNSECGIPGEGSHRSTIMLYHPKECSVYSRVFIFAHELGHALHLALTGSVEIIPNGYDEINEKLGVVLPTLKEKQEGFADMTAYAILSNGLEHFLPAEFNKDGAKYFLSFIKNIIGRSQKPE